MAARQLAAENEAAEAEFNQRLWNLLKTSRKYSLLVLKSIASFVKFMLEDMLNALAQLIFAMKFWEDLTMAMQVFTVGSLGAGVTVALFSFMKDVLAALGVRNDASHRGINPSELALDPTGFEEQLDERLAARGEEEEGREVADPAAERPHTHTSGTQSGEQRPLIGTRRPTMRRIDFPDVEMVDFVASDMEGAASAHRALVVCALTYWGGMALIPLLFGKQIQGGVAAAVPNSAVMFFTLVTTTSVLAELWVAGKTYMGQKLIQELPQIVMGACQNYAKAMPILGCMLSIVARYDTFCDVVFTVILCKTEPITFIKFEHVVEMTIHLPCELHKVALFSLTVGVFGVQGLPGLGLLLRKRYLGAAFKLNEFCVLLSLLELELQ